MGSARWPKYQQWSLFEPLSSYDLQIPRSHRPCIWPRALRTKWPLLNLPFAVAPRPSPLEQPDFDNYTVPYVVSRAANTLRDHVLSGPRTNAVHSAFLNSRPYFSGNAATDSEWIAPHILGEGGFGLVACWRKRTPSLTLIDELAIKDQGRQDDALHKAKRPDEEIRHEVLSRRGLLKESVIQHELVAVQHSEHVVNIRGYKWIPRDGRGSDKKTRTQREVTFFANNDISVLPLGPRNFPATAEDAAWLREGRYREGDWPALRLPGGEKWDALRAQLWPPGSDVPRRTVILRLWGLAHS